MDKMASKGDLAKRLREQIGIPYVDDQHGARIEEDKIDIWFSVPSEHAKKILLNEVMTIYDIQRELWIGGRIAGMDVRKIGTTDRDRMLYDEQEVPIIDQVIAGHTYPSQGSQLVKVNPISAFDQNHERTVPNFVTSPISVLLHPISEPQSWGEPTIYEILDLPPEGILVGIYSQNQRLYLNSGGKYLKYNLNLEKLTNRHIVILGSTGSGKTVALKELALELADIDGGVLIFDLQGDIIQIIESGGLPDTVEDKAVWESLGWKNETISPDRVKVFAPVTSGENYDVDELETIRKYCNMVGVEFKEFCLQQRYVVSGTQLAMHLLRLTDKARGSLSRLFELYRPQTLRGFINDLENEADRTGYYISWQKEEETLSMHPTTYENMMGQLRDLSSLGIFDVLGREEPDVEELLERGKITIIYLSHLPEELRARYELHIPYKILDARTRVPSSSIIIDEAHEAIPRGGEGYPALASEVFGKIARQGRKYDIDLIVSTHKPRDLNPVVYDLAGSMIVFRTSKDDARTIGMPLEFHRTVEHFNPGFALINSPENSRVPWIEIKIPWARCIHMKPKDFRGYIKKKLEKRGKSA